MNAQDREALLHILKTRFDKNTRRHAGLAWADAQARLEANPDALRSLQQMEATGGEPDVIGRDGDAGPFTFCDCAAESPAGRRSLCYDRAALDPQGEPARGQRRRGGRRDGRRTPHRRAVPRAPAAR